MKGLTRIDLVKGRMRINILIIAVLLLIPVFSNAQVSRYSPGYVVDSNGDTLKGFIDDTRITELHHVVWFKENEAQEKAIFHPSNIKGFGFNDNSRAVFESRQNFICVNNANKVDTLDIFVAMLASGEVSLFRYQDKSKAVHYFIEKAGKVFQLKDKTVLLTDQSGTVRKKRNRDFNGLFNILLGDCDKQSYDLSFNPRQFVQIVNDYNLCKAQKNIQSLSETRSVLAYTSQGNLNDTAINAPVTVLVKGAVSLLLFEDRSSKKHYFLEKGSRIVELQDRINYTLLTTGEVTKTRDKRYNRVLEEFIGDCSQRSYDLDFDLQLFSRSVLAYNLCKSKAVSVHGNQKMRVSVSLRGGVSHSRLRFYETQYYNYINGKPTPLPLQLHAYTDEPVRHYSPLVGLNWNFESWKNKHISVDLGFQITRYNWKSSVVKIQMLSLELPAAIKWSMLLKKRYRPFINVGLTYSKAVSTSSSISYSKNYSSRPSTLRFALGGGIDYVNKNSSKISLGARWEEAGGFINSASLTSRLNALNIFVSVPFPKTTKK